MLTLLVILVVGCREPGARGPAAVHAARRDGAAVCAWCLGSRWGHAAHHRGGMQQRRQQQWRLRWSQQFSLVSNHSSRCQSFTWLSHEVACLSCHFTQMHGVARFQPPISSAGAPSACLWGLYTITRCSCAAASTWRHFPTTSRWQRGPRPCPLGQAKACRWWLRWCTSGWWGWM